MENIFVSGGVPLTGTVRISGSKNSALAVMAGALLHPFEDLRELALAELDGRVAARLVGEGAELVADVRLDGPHPRFQRQHG